MPARACDVTGFPTMAAQGPRGLSHVKLRHTGLFAGFGVEALGAISGARLFKAFLQRTSGLYAAFHFSLALLNTYRPCIALEGVLARLHNFGFVACAIM